MYIFTKWEIQPPAWAGNLGKSQCPWVKSTDSSSSTSQVLGQHLQFTLQKRCLVDLPQSFSMEGTFALQGTSGNVCRHTWLSQLEEGFCWHQVGKHQGCCYTSHNANDLQDSKELSDPKMSALLLLRTAQDELIQKHTCREVSGLIQWVDNTPIHTGKPVAWCDETVGSGSQNTPREMLWVLVSMFISPTEQWTLIGQFTSSPNEFLKSFVNHSFFQRIFIICLFYVRC